MVFLCWRLLLRSSRLRALYVGVNARGTDFGKSQPKFGTEPAFEVEIPLKNLKHDHSFRAILTSGVQQSGKNDEQHQGRRDRAGSQSFFSMEGASNVGSKRALRSLEKSKVVIQKKVGRNSTSVSRSFRIFGLTPLRARVLGTLPLSLSKATWGL